jgi:hypothetical protein
VNSNIFIPYIDLKTKICIEDKSLEIWNRVHEVQLQKLVQTLCPANNNITSHSKFIL